MLFLQTIIKMYEGTGGSPCEFMYEGGLLQASPSDPAVSPPPRFASCKQKVSHHILKRGGACRGGQASPQKVFQNREEQNELVA